MIAGAASVIGQAVAERLAAEGATVVGIDRQEHAVGAMTLVADLSDERQVSDTFARLHAQTGRIDVLYNNAGLISPHDQSALETSTETLDEIFRANFRTVWLCCKPGIPYLLRNDPPGGSVINTSSFLAGMARPRRRWPTTRPRRRWPSSAATSAPSSRVGGARQRARPWPDGNSFAPGGV